MAFAAALADLGPVLLGLAVVLAAAIVAGEVALRLRQSQVVGEILAGVVLGNLAAFGVPYAEFLAPERFLEVEALGVLAELGILVLIFSVGVEATVGQMRRTGVSALLVALLGVAVPLGLGAGTSWAFLPAAPTQSHLFVGAILCATSVGITARVLKELGRTRTPEARLVLGAAVIDDVLGLLLLATVAATIRAEEAGVALGAGPLLLVLVKALAFLGGAVLLGSLLAPRMFRVATRWRTPHILLPVSLSFCFLLSWLAWLVDLAPIVGAFTAGLVLEDVQFEELATRERRSLEELLQPLMQVLVPVFFVLIGMRVDATRYGDPWVLLLAGALFAAAVVGKLACALGVRDRGVDRLAVGIGMVPRGEVGFVFAGIGTSLTLAGEPVVSPSVFAAAVLVVLGTTLVTPLALARRFRRLPVPPPDRPAPDGRAAGGG
jgi:Kef-type K+ transport system membrane component KefB